MNETSSALSAAVQRSVYLAKNQPIYDEGEPAKAMYRVEAGCVRLQLDGADGSRQIIRFVFPGEVFDWSLERHMTTAEAVTQSVSAYRDLARHLGRVASLPAVDRIAEFLDLLRSHTEIDHVGKHLRLPMSHRDAADHLMIAPETLSRALRLFHERRTALAA